MNEALQSALAGEPVTVTLGGKIYPLAFPMQGVILYKQATAALDRERNGRQRALGTPALTHKEKRELRERRRKLMAEADGLRPEKGEPWSDDNWALFEELMAEALQSKAALDQDAAAGDSLYDKGNWWKISPEGDPERLLLALWVGLHRFSEISLQSPQPAARSFEARNYASPLTREQLGGLINLTNGEDLTVAVAKALRAHLIAPAEEGEDESPNAPPPAAPAETPLPDTVIVTLGK